MIGKLIIFCAPSGSGKTTIVRHLLNLKLQLEFSISATSREPRASEVNGKDYHFLSVEDFKQKASKNEFLEWEEVYKNQFYGTLKSDVQKRREEGKHVIFDIDVVGGLKLKKEFKDAALAVFVKAPSIKEMENRLRDRATDSEEQLTKRIAKAEEELAYAPSFDYILINDNLDTALNEAEQIVREFINK